MRRGKKKNELVLLVSACERAAVFDRPLACVSAVLACVKFHTPAEPGAAPTARISDPPPKYVTGDEPLLNHPTDLRAVARTKKKKRRTPRHGGTR